jgi:hypothetical protein
VQSVGCAPYLGPREDLELTFENRDARRRANAGREVRRRDDERLVATGTFLQPRRSWVTTNRDGSRRDRRNADGLFCDHCVFAGRGMSRNIKSAIVNENLSAKYKMSSRTISTHPNQRRAWDSNPQVLSDNGFQARATNPQSSLNHSCTTWEVLTLHPHNTIESDSSRPIPRKECQENVNQPPVQGHRHRNVRPLPTRLGACRRSARRRYSRSSLCRPRPTARVEVVVHARAPLVQ